MTIDLLLEKWLTAFKKYGKTVEVFENPSAKEFRDIKTSFRFILDSKHKKIYVWSASDSLHVDTWVYIKKELNDSRQVYKSGTLLAVISWTYFTFSPDIQSSVKKELKETDWSFASRWVDIKELKDTLEKL